jgi:hypothetical protein
MDIADSIKTSVTLYRTTRRYISDNCRIQIKVYFILGGEVNYIKLIYLNMNITGLGRSVASYNGIEVSEESDCSFFRKK